MFTHLPTNVYNQAKYSCQGLQVSAKAVIVVGIKSAYLRLWGRICMKWTEKCILDLSHHSLFEDDGHRRRFYDLLDCYFEKPFFSKGLCKCMYLSAWDAEHFSILLDTLNSTLIEKDFHLNLMRDQGEILQTEAHEAKDPVSEEMWKLTNSFLNGKTYELSGLAELEVSAPESAYIIKRSLAAAKLIDELPPVRG